MFMMWCNDVDYSVFAGEYIDFPSHRAVLGLIGTHSGRMRDTLLRTLSADFYFYSAYEQHLPSLYPLTYASILILFQNRICSSLTRKIPHSRNC